MSVGFAAGIVGSTSTHLMSATAEQHAGEYSYSAIRFNEVSAWQLSWHRPTAAAFGSSGPANAGPEVMSSTRNAALFARTADLWRIAHMPKPRVVAKPVVKALPVVETVAAPPPPPAQSAPPAQSVPSSVPSQTEPSSGIWYRLRLCESGSNYSDNTGNGYYGAYQFAPSTWTGLGFPGLPSQASPAVQDEAAKMLQARSGWGQWPSCSSELGL
jgi:hypothetical protein